MPKLNLTLRAIDRLPAPDPSGKQILHWDTDLKGLAVLCSGTTNAKSYIVQRTLPDGRNRRLTIGAVNEISLDKAKLLAGDILQELRHGRDPKKKIDNPTLKSTLEAYLLALGAMAESAIAGHRRRYGGGASPRYRRSRGISLDRLQMLQGHGMGAIQDDPREATESQRHDPRPARRKDALR
jgi:hypothetical protein